MKLVVRLRLRACVGFLGTDAKLHGGASPLFPLNKGLTLAPLKYTLGIIGRYHDAIAVVTSLFS